MDRIAFRLRGHYFSSFESEIEVVEVLVNDAPLVFLWSEAGGGAAVPMSRDELGSGADHLWGGNPSDGGALLEDGRWQFSTAPVGVFPVGAERRASRSIATR